MVTANATLTESQQARRTRMLQATEELALQGGWDGVQMREVAMRAGVALGTLYRYFPSKEHLLVSVMLDEVQQLADRLAIRPPEGDDPVERVIDVLRRANRALNRQPDVTVAMIRALVAGNPDVAPVVAGVRKVMRRIISDALGATTSEDAEDGDVLAIDLLSDVWLAALVSWISGVQEPAQVIAKLEDATEVLLG
ncbi:TetR family transcriptional regulator [Dermatobacter hominis]|uniref:TetR family transcriptional regulator n=1 Tax=Dermatobacter hominis TaxID=2884263 RepID=UPI001D10D708|nr:TetR family transcriptional regulator [Dermatobacter hominis]UDY37802.1 TetR family transcriptional regulator [Dermatobacter hominis]